MENIREFIFLPDEKRQEQELDMEQAVSMETWCRTGECVQWKATRLPDSWMVAGILKEKSEAK